VSLSVAEDHEQAENRRRLLESARRRFPAYYEAAAELDAGLMDDLVLARQAATVLANLPRRFIPEPIRLHVDKTSDAVDQIFSHCRELVRGSPTFAALSESKRAQISLAAFTVPFPAELAPLVKMPRREAL